MSFWRCLRFLLNLFCLGLLCDNWLYFFYFFDLLRLISFIFNICKPSSFHCWSLFLFPFRIFIFFFNNCFISNVLCSLRSLFGVICDFLSRWRLCFLRLSNFLGFFMHTSFLRLDNQGINFWCKVFQRFKSFIFVWLSKAAKDFCVKVHSLNEFINKKIWTRSLLYSIFNNCLQNLFNIAWKLEFFMLSSKLNGQNLIKTSFQECFVKLDRLELFEEKY